MNPFVTARWRLTLWYMLISCALLTIFTLAALLAEHQAFLAVRELVHSQVRGIVFNAVLQAEIDNFERDFAQRLIVFDILMFVVSGLASYILSGRTLKPIEQMVREQQAFAADASHELRTPLANIAMEIEARKRSEFPPRSADAELLDSIQTEVSRMRGMVAGLLSLVRMEGANELPPTVVDLSELTGEVVAGMMARFDEKQLRISSHIAPGLRVKGQPDELRQLLLILLDNAVLYTPKKGTVDIVLQAQQAKVSLVVQNSGPTIPDDELPLLFKRFYRGQKVTQPGTGLGLAIARVLVERYGGNIGVASQADKGVSFRVLLPMVGSSK
jgi:two-component system, OmpR family, sensor histidine kinase CiaH